MNDLTNPRLATTEIKVAKETLPQVPPGGGHPKVANARFSTKARRQGGSFDVRENRHTGLTLTALAQRLLSGDLSAEQAFVDSALRRLVGLLVVKGARDDAEDYALDAIAEALVRLPRLAGCKDGHDPVFAYMAQTALNRMRRAHREHARERRALALLAGVQGAGEQRSGLVERPLWTSEPPPERTRAAVAAAAQAVLNALSELDRALVELRVETNLTWADIGRELGAPAEVVRQRWHRIRRRFLATMPAPEEL